MKKNILIIGRKSFIGSNLFTFLKNKQNTKIVDYKMMLKKNLSELSNFDYIINCTSNEDYIKKKYSKKKDFDFIIANKIKSLDIKMIFLSSRKIYKSGFDLKETNRPNPVSNYSKNKLTSEKNLKKIFKKNILILRIANLIGTYMKHKNKLHHTFQDIFFDNIRKGIIFENDKCYKDFLSIKQFSLIVNELINNNATGTYNVSIGKKIYLNLITKWLNYYNKNDYKYVKLQKTHNNDSFTLNNQKLMNKISILNRIVDLKNDCKMISKNFFNNK
jgi:dTDP-4-dehydrorhamnose reductase